MQAITGLIPYANTPVLDKAIGVFLAVMGLYALYSHCFKGESFIPRLMNQKSGQGYLKYTIVLSIAVHILGVWLLIK